MITGNSSIGQRFRVAKSVSIYLLCLVDTLPDKVMLIDINTGRPWYVAVTVKDIYRISKEEFITLLGPNTNPSIFERIEGKK